MFNKILEYILIVLYIPIFELVVCVAILYLWLHYKKTSAYPVYKVRFACVLLLSLLLTIVCGLISISIFTYILPINDGASGAGFRILIDPFILIPTLLLTIPFGVFLTPEYYKSTLQKNLFRCSVYIYSRTLLAATVFSILTPAGALTAAIIVVLKSMENCRKTNSQYFISPNVT